MKRTNAYKVYALGARDVRKTIRARRLIIELRPDIEVELDLAPHPNFRGHLMIFTPPTSKMSAEYAAGKIDEFAVIFGGSNVLHVVVERRLRDSRRSNSRATKGITRSKRSASDPKPR
jgi:hypothetical protein